MERLTQLLLVSTVLAMLLVLAATVAPLVTASDDDDDSDDNSDDKLVHVTYFRESEIVCAPADGAGGVEVCTVVAFCEIGDIITGGGFREHSDQSAGLLWDHFETRPEIDQNGINGWFVEGVNPTTNDFILTAYAVCLESH